MPKFDVKVARTVLHVATITVEAEDEDKATEMVEAGADEDNPHHKIFEGAEWYEEDSAYEVEEVNDHEDEDDED